MPVYEAPIIKDIGELRIWEGAIVELVEGG